MDSNALRERYVCQTLTHDMLNDPAPFYDAFEESEDAMVSYFTGLWETLCRETGEALERHPFFPDVVPYVLEDTPEGFCALVTFSLPRTADASPVMGVVVFGSAMDPRVFAALPTELVGGETLKIVECRERGTVDVAVLFQGCDNGLQLFDPPAPQKRDKDKPLGVDRREPAVVDAVVCWCMEHD